GFILNETAVKAMNLEDPNIFLIPISFVLWSAMYDDRPNNPKQEMNMARIVQYNIIVSVFSSDLYELFIWSSTYS
ncbi:hypothetical protein ACFLSY_10990, partial [Bacteroidota bacterium]